MHPYFPELQLLHRRHRRCSFGKLLFGRRRRLLVLHLCRRHRRLVGRGLGHFVLLVESRGGLGHRVEVLGHLVSSLGRRSLVELGGQGKVSVVVDGLLVGVVVVDRQIASWPMVRSAEIKMENDSMSVCGIRTLYQSRRGRAYLCELQRDGLSSELDSVHLGVCSLKGYGEVFAVSAGFLRSENGRRK